MPWNPETIYADTPVYQPRPDVRTSGGYQGAAPQYGGQRPRPRPRPVGPAAQGSPVPNVAPPPGGPQPPAPPPPAAPPPGLQGQGAGGQGGLPDSSALNAYIAKLMGNPDPYANESFQRDMLAGMRNIDDQFNMQKTLTDEEMAKRGLHDSSIAGGRLQDLNVGKRSAQTSLMDSLAANRARDYMSNALGVGQLALGGQSGNLNAYNSQNNFLLALAQMMGGNMDWIGG